MRITNWKEAEKAANKIKQGHPFDCIRVKFNDDKIEACIRASDDGWSVQFLEQVEGVWQWCSIPVHPGMIKEVLFPGENA